MFEHLHASGSTQRRSPVGPAVSLIFHTGIAAGVIATQRAVVTTPPPVSRTESEVFVAPSARAATPTATAPRVTPSVSMHTPAPALPLPSVAPIAIPSTIAPVVLDAGLSLDDVMGSRDTDREVVGRRGPGLVGSDGAGDGPFGVITAGEADVPAERLSGPYPAYPEVMRRAGLEGWVRLRFVVGVDGRVEKSTLQVVESSHSAFEAPATEAVIAATFRPARVRGQAVRQLVDQQIRFRITP